MFEDLVDQTETLGTFGVEEFIAFEQFLCERNENDYGERWDGTAYRWPRPSDPYVLT